MHAFQRQVLGDKKFWRGPSLTTRAKEGDEGGRAFRVVILNREDGNKRVWAYSREASHMMQDTWGDVLGGVGFYGYPHGRSPVADTPLHDPATGEWRDAKGWQVVRDMREIRASPESVLFALPELLQAGINCRRQWAATH